MEKKGAVRCQYSQSSEIINSVLQWPVLLTYP